jgi:hypothetical protein
MAGVSNDQQTPLKPSFFRGLLTGFRVEHLNVAADEARLHQLDHFQRHVERNRHQVVVENEKRDPRQSRVQIVLVLQEGQVPAAQSSRESGNS